MSEPFLIINCKKTEKKYNIYEKFFGEYIYLYTTHDDMIIVFFMDKYEKLELYYNKEMKNFIYYSELLPNELNYNNRKVKTEDLIYFIKQFIGQELTEKILLKINFRIIYGEFINILELFIRLNKIIDNMKINDEKKIFDIKFKLYKIIETL